MSIVRAFFGKLSISRKPSVEAEYINILLEAFDGIGEVLGDGPTAYDVGERFTCSQVDVLALALAVGGQIEAAATLLEGHASGDSARDHDVHLGGERFDGGRYLRDIAELAAA